jgi:phthalate 4,5-dioxygenase oxygenase subunit
MLTDAENELITRVGKGTAMGAYMRRFWFPVSKSANLEAGGRPKRVRLLGENFVLFRAADGRVALLAEACPHRGASLALARVEDCAIRCIFHGWKIDVEGNVVDVPSQGPERETYGARVNVRHYPTREAGTLVWAFIGEGEPTKFPDFPFTHLPDDQITILDVPVECNYLQGLEIQLDTSHVGLLHRSTLKDLTPKVSPSFRQTERYFMGDTSPRYEVVSAPYGLRAIATRHAEPGRLFSRVTEFCVPIWTGIPSPDDQDYSIVAQVPVDDTHTIQYFIMFNFDHAIDRESLGHGLQTMLDYDGPSFSRNARSDNLWEQDPALLEAGHWSGLRNVLYEDFAIAESQGAIADRAYENAVQCDEAIMRGRRVLINAARDHRDGKAACGLGEDIDYAGMFGCQATYPEDGSWADAVAAVRDRRTSLR